MHHSTKSELNLPSMASFTRVIILSFLLISLSVSHAQASSSSKPKALVLPVSKDPSTLQYITHLNIGTPSMSKSLVVDLNGRNLWIDCKTGCQSSTYKPGYCGSSSCSVSKAYCISGCFNPPEPGCHNNTCRLLTQNTVHGTFDLSEVAIDTISLHTTDGSRAASRVSIPSFIFAISYFFNLDHLSAGVTGMLGLSKNQISFPSLLASSFGGSFRRKFAICLPSIEKSKGVLFFGDSPYVFHPGYNTSRAIDVSSRFKYTKLHVNYERTASPRVLGAQLPGYFVKVTSIWVNKKPIPINSTLLDFHRTGIGGSTISTVQPYSVLETSIYKSLVKVFDKEISVHNVSKVAAVAPFTDCYKDSKGNLGMTILGIGVPDIAFVFENRDVYWEIYGANSMVEISRDTWCLAFMDGGSDAATSIVIGAHQMQDNLLQFDIASSRLAFTSTLVLEEIECSNFKF